MKHQLFIPGLLLAGCGFCTGLFAAVTVQVMPNPMVVGETGQLQIISNDDTPDVPKLPQIPNLQWASGAQTSKSIQIVNFKKSVQATTTYVFLVSKPGTYTIPAMEVKVDGRPVKTDPCTFQAEEGRAQVGGAESASISMGEAVQGTFKPLREPAAGKWYAGQEIPALLEVMVAESLFRGGSLPDLKLENAVAATPRQPEAGNAQSGFDRHEEGRVIRAGIPFRLFRFPVRIIPLAPGMASGVATMTLNLRGAANNRRPRGGDPFFDDFFPREELRQHQVNAVLNPLTVEAVPAPPVAAGVFLGLCGEWTLVFAATPADVPQGDPLTLALTVRGTGNLATFTPPKLDLPGFRVYEPEVKKSADSATVTWVVQPLRMDSALPPLTFCTFSPETGSYAAKTFTPKVKVLPPVFKTGAASVADAGGAPRISNAPETHAANDIFYVKSAPGPQVRRPLRDNALPLTLLLYAAGVLALCGFTFAARRRERLQRDPDWQRRQHARNSLRNILGAIAHAPGDERAALFREQLAPCLAALLRLPPGTTAGELADKLEAGHPELASALRSAEAGQFRPGAGTAIDAPHLLRAVKRLGFLAAFLLLLPLAAGARAAAPPPSWEAATNAYAKGEFAQAAESWRALQTPATQDPHRFFNLGNCAYRLGNFGEAVACYETARRLAPRDTDILENLNFVRGRLGLPLANQVETPRQLLVHLRDSLRPDEWLLLGGVWCAAGLGLAGWFRWRSAKPWLCVTATVAGLLLLLGLILSQQETTYAANTQAVVLENLPETHRLPDAASDRAELKLKQGESVTVIEERAGWSRVRAGDSEAWLGSRELRQVW